MSRFPNPRNRFASFAVSTKWGATPPVKKNRPKYPRTHFKKTCSRTTRRELESELHFLFDLACAPVFEYELSGSDRVFKLESLNPGLLVQAVTNAVSNLAEYYLQSHSHTPCSREKPWHAVVGFDEFNPGNATAGTNAKKTMCLYFNFLELGSDCLSKTASWYCSCVLSCRMEGLIDGRWTRVFADHLEMFFLGAFGLQNVGVLIQSGSRRSMMLYATLGIIISDGDGLRKALNWRGASSMRPCFRHDNVIKKGTNLTLPSDWFCISHCRYSDFTRRSSQDLWDACDKIQAAHDRFRSGNITRGLYEMIMKSEALNYHPQGLLWRLSLRDHLDVYNTIRYDWVHTLLQDGPLHIELFLFLNGEGVAYASIVDWLKLNWEYPKQFRTKSNQSHEIFDEWRNKRDDDSKLHCSCSEMLGVYLLVRLYIETQLPDSAAKASLLLCCRLIDIMQAAKKKTIAMAQAAIELRRTHESFMRKHIEVYGKDHVTPKFHWVFDLVDQLLADTYVFDQLIIERLHLRVKDVAVNIDNLRRWERSVLSFSLKKQIAELEDFACDCKLIGREAHDEQYPTAIFANCMRVYSMTIAKGDVVVCKVDGSDVVGRVAIVFKADDTFFVVIAAWKKVVSKECLRWAGLK